MKDIFQYLTTYWQQLLLVFSAIGFVVAKFMEVRLKQKEIRYNFYFKEKIDLILKFHNVYIEFITEARKLLEKAEQQYAASSYKADVKYGQLTDFETAFILLTNKRAHSIFNQITGSAHEYLQNIKLFKEKPELFQNANDLSFQNARLEKDIDELFGRLGKHINS